MKLLAEKYPRFEKHNNKSAILEKMWIIQYT